MVEQSRNNSSVKEIVDRFSDGEIEIIVPLVDTKYLQYTRRINRAGSLRALLKQQGFPVTTSIIQDDKTGDYKLLLARKK